MFKLIFKCIFSFIVCFIILSFKINDKVIFNHLSELTGPLGQDVQSSLTKSAKRTLKKSQAIFTNAEPKLRDEIKSKKSSLKKQGKKSLEHLKLDEMKKLDEIIKNN